MADSNSFPELIRRIRAGDGQAAAELVRRYEPMIRLEARLRMTDRKLSRLFDSLDICQSVLASFFVRAAVGQYDLERPEQLIQLLTAMVRNKVAGKARRVRARAADRRRVETDGLDVLASREPEPSQLAARRELLDEVRRRLNVEEWQIVELRGQGHSWPEVAAEMGGTAEGRRKQLTRALDLVVQQLGLEELGDAPL